MRKLLGKSKVKCDRQTTPYVDFVLGEKIKLKTEAEYKPFYRVTQELSGGIVFYKASYMVRRLTPIIYLHVPVEEDYKYFDNEKDAKNWRSEKEGDEI